MRIFLDANILFSAAKTDGAIRSLLEMLLEADHECWADGYVVEGARRNLLAKAPDKVDELGWILDRISIAAVVRDVALEAALPLPEKDRPVLAAAIRSACAVLVTGDKTHFSELYGTSVHGVTIHSPRSLAKAIGIIGSSRGTANERRVGYRVKRLRRLDAQFDPLLDGMQRSRAKRGMAAAYRASPAKLGRAAVNAARKRWRFPKRRVKRLTHDGAKMASTDRPGLDPTAPRTARPRA